MARYEAGETLSSIARTYDCSPPAISYIVSRSKEKPASEVSPPPPAEPQLVKAQTNGAVTNGAGANGAGHNEVPIAPPPAAEIRREPAADPRPAATANGDQRRKLHLSLGNGNGSTNGAERPAPLNFTVPPSAQVPPRTPNGFDTGRNGRDLFAAPETARLPAEPPRVSDIPRNGNSAFIDHELRSRVDGDIAAFLAAFDAALAADTHESRFGLREATDRLLRAGARTRIELERLEAKLPLPPRDGGAQPDPGAWRYR
jgi:hypothetical protein